jgi:hypothetical protein
MGKAAEADLFRQWLVAHLMLDSSAAQDDTASPTPIPDRGKSPVG